MNLEPSLKLGGQEVVLVLTIYVDVCFTFVQFKN